MTTKYVLFLPPTEFPDKEMKKDYIDWVEKNKEISRRFKKKIYQKQINVKTSWHHHRILDCSRVEVKTGSLELSSSTVHVDAKFGNKIYSDGKYDYYRKDDYKPAHDETSYSLDINTKTLVFSKKEGDDCLLTYGTAPNEKQEKESIVVNCESLDDVQELVSKSDYEMICKSLDSFSLSFGCKDSVKDMVKRRYKDDTSETHFFAHVEEISDADIEEQTIIIYPVHTLEVRNGIKKYRTTSRYSFWVPESAPASNSFRVWTHVSRFARFMNFAIFLATLGIAIGLLIFSDSQPAVALSEMGGIPSLLCGVWIFPINIICVALPFWLIDNFTIDIDDLKEKTKAYTLYNTVYLAIAALVLGGAHLLMHQICFG